MPEEAIDWDAASAVLVREGDSIQALVANRVYNSIQAINDYTMNAWGAPTQGAWAAQVDEEEKANGGTLDAPKEPVITFGQDKAFPTLGEAVKKKDSKKDKKKPQKMNLADFQSNYKPPSASRRPTVNDDQILLSLPTAPRARDSDEPSAGLGGAFKDYGGDRGDGDKHRDRGSFFGRRDRDGDSQDGSERGFGDEPSRADAVDDWGASRKFVPSSGGSGGGSGGFGSGGFGSRREERGEPGEEGPSRADTVDDWGASRKFTPTSSGSGGFDDKGSSRGFGSSRRGDDDFEGGPSRADAESRWGKKFTPSSGVSSSGGSGGFEDRPSRDRDGESTWGSRRTSDAPEAPAAGGRPRLKLAPRTKPLPVLEIPPEAKLPEKKEPQPEELPVVTGPPKPKPNPFGAARPREEVLKEQGKDWKEEEEKLETKPATDRWKTGGTSDIREGLDKLPQKVASALDGAENTEDEEPKTPENGDVALSAEVEGSEEVGIDKATEQKAPLSGAEATE